MPAQLGSPAPRAAQGRGWISLPSQRTVSSAYLPLVATSRQRPLVRACRLPDRSDQSSHQNPGSTEVDFQPHGSRASSQNRRLDGRDSRSTRHHQRLLWCLSPSRSSSPGPLVLSSSSHPLANCTYQLHSFRYCVLHSFHHWRLIGSAITSRLLQHRILPVTSRPHSGLAPAPQPPCFQTAV